MTFLVQQNSNYANQQICAENFQIHNLNISRSRSFGGFHGVCFCNPLYVSASVCLFGWNVGFAVHIFQQPHMAVCCSCCRVCVLFFALLSQMFVSIDFAIAMWFFVYTCEYRIILLHSAHNSQMLDSFSDMWKRAVYKLKIANPRTYAKH